MVGRSSDICYAKGLILLTRGVSPHSKLAPQSRSAARFRPLPVSQGRRVFLRSQRTNPRPEMAWLCLDIREPRRRSRCIGHPAASSRMLTFEFGFSDSRGGAISAMAVSQGHLGGPCALIRAQKGRGLLEISANHGVASAASARMLT